MTLLTLEEYRSTITPKMFEVKDTSALTADIWLYAEQLVKEKILSADVLEERLIDGIYRNSDNTFEHVQLPMDNPNVFTFIIIDLNLAIIKGHFCLDL